MKTQRQLQSCGLLKYPIIFRSFSAALTAFLQQQLRQSAYSAQNSQYSAKTDKPKYFHCNSLLFPGYLLELFLGNFPVLVPYVKTCFCDFISLNVF